MGTCSFDCLKKIWKFITTWITPALPLTDFITDSITVYTWYNLCYDDHKEEFCLYWKLGVVFMCLPSVIGSIWCFYMGLRRKEYCVALLTAAVMLFWPLVSP